VRVGPALSLGELGLSESADEQQIADAIMRRVASLLPPEMRGYYAEDVRKAS
jgi:hypothetical protein